jgi:hypothetical protein
MDFPNTRASRALDLRRQGFTFAEISKRFGMLSREGARQLVKRGEEIEHRRLSTDPWNELSARARNALLGQGCKPSPNGVIAAYRRWAAQFDVKVPFWHFLMRIPNIASTTAAEVEQWLVRHGKRIPEPK